ncbi:MAG: OmpA family protein [Verrucomicrobiales bacterium]|nr:OmpA family protein [Verrucomicrobiales bacterium]
MRTPLLALILASSSLAKDGEFQMPVADKAPEKKVIPAAELSRVWTAETRSFTDEKRTTAISAEHLRTLRTAGADRGINVVPDGQGGGQITVGVDPASSVTFQNIHFKLNSTELADESSRQQVEQIAEAMKTAAGKQFVLEGHTCDLGTDAHNLGLSERRAAAILQMLMARGVSAAQLLPLGFGEARPAVPNTSEANREENRRVVISVRQ